MLERVETFATARRQFSADASHELRSPLASARAQLEVGLAYPDRTDWTATATEVRVELARLETLSGDLLTLAKVEVGSAAINRAPVDLRELLAGELDSPNGSDIAVHYVAPSSALTVSGDRELLLRALRNLLANARRHAKSTISIETTSDQSSVSITVSNDGPSIPADKHEAIFEPFTRLDDARSADEGGAGLGLVIVRNILTDHGGTAVSVPVPSGARFVMTLPRAAGAEIGGSPLHR